MIHRKKDISKDYTANSEYQVWIGIIFFECLIPKKCRLGPQNSSESSGPEKLPKIVNCATIKETEKLKETMVGVQVE
jgi:hypothetical protein